MQSSLLNSQAQDGVGYELDRKLVPAFISVSFRHPKDAGSRDGSTPDPRPQIRTRIAFACAFVKHLRVLQRKSSS